MSLTVLGSSACQVTAVDGRPGTHILRVPVLDSGSVVFGYIVTLEIVAGNGILRSNPCFMPSAAATFDATATAEASAVGGRAGMSVLRVPLNADGAYVGWIETAVVGGGGAVVASEPVAVIPVESGGGGSTAWADLTGVPGPVTALSGTNTGDQTITLTSDVTGSGTGSFAATIAAGAVTLAKQANMATASVVYRKTAGSGAPEVNTLATLKTDLGLTGTNSGDQTTVIGNAGTATALQTARTINGVSFDGTGNITIAAAAGTLTGSTLASGVTGSSLTSLGTIGTGVWQGTIIGPTYGGTGVNNGSYTITCTANATIGGTHSGTSSGTNTGDQTSVSGSSGSCTGNAATATALATGRTINGVTFDGTGNITVAAAAGTLTGSTLASGVTGSSLTSLGTIGTGVWQGTIVGPTYGGTGVNNGSFTITCTANATIGGTHSGTSSGTNTGDQTSVSGSSGSCTGNAATATALATPRAINGVNFDGSAAITVAAAGSTLTGSTIAAGMLGTSSATACAGNDSRLSDSRAPSGSAGGDLTGTYPNPTINAGAVTLAKQDAAAVTRTITVTFGDGTNVPATNTKARIARLPSGGTITKWSIVGDASGSATIDVQKASAASTPSFSSMVGGGTKPAVSSAVASVGNSPASWSGTTFSATDMLLFNLDSVSTMKSVTLNLEYTAS